MRYFEGEYDSDEKNGHGCMVYEEAVLEGRWRNGLCSLELREEMLVD